MSYLIYINGLGPDYKGDNLYEFIFSDTKEVWGESWDNQPAAGYPHPPELEFIKKVGILRNTEIKLDLIQNSDLFSLVDSMDGVVALGWEPSERDRDERLVFSFGEAEKTVKDKLYEMDLILEFEKDVIYEN
jgi:hypothetical protein